MEWALAIIPTLICGLALWYIKRRSDKADKKEEQREKREEQREAVRVKNNVLLLKGVSASLLLGEATADVIETKQFNCKMTDAREYAKQAKRDIDDFMRQQGSEHVV